VERGDRIGSVLLLVPLGLTVTDAAIVAAEQEGEREAAGQDPAA
jgi:hypothetical protein